MFLHNIIELNMSNTRILQATDSFCFYIYNAYNLLKHNGWLSPVPPFTNMV